MDTSIISIIALIVSWSTVRSRMPIIAGIIWLLLGLWLLELGLIRTLEAHPNPPGGRGD